MSDSPAEEVKEAAEPAKAAEETPAPEPAHDAHHDECRGRAHGLEERIKTLEDALNAVVQFKPDSTPVKKPWTHRG